MININRALNGNQFHTDQPWMAVNFGTYAICAAALSADHQFNPIIFASMEVC